MATLTYYDRDLLLELQADLLTGDLRLGGDIDGDGLPDGDEDWAAEYAPGRCDSGTYVVPNTKIGQPAED